MEAKLYTKRSCPYSKTALATLKRFGIPFENIDITDDDELREQMVKDSGGKTTVPQIFLDGEHIGGADDLLRMELNGELGSPGDAASP